MILNFLSSNTNNKKELNKKLARTMSKAYKKVFGKKISSKDSLHLLSYIEGNISRFTAKRMDVAQKLFNYGKIDLEASNLLYKENIYPLAIYHLQQAIEKITKAYFLESGMIELEELYPKGTTNKKETVGHLSPKALILAIEKKEIKSNLEILFRCSNFSKIDSDKEAKKLRSLIRKRIKVAKISENEINQVVKTFRTTYKVLKAKLPKREMRHKIHLFNLSVSSQIKKIKEFKDEIRDIDNVLKYLEKDATKNVERNFVALNLYLLSIITFPHFISTRYPKEKRGLSPEDYNKELGIVKAFPQLRNMTRSIIESFERNIFI
jgi:HEPN domain-containing protein